MGLISLQKRIDRINNTTHVVYVEDMTVHLVRDIRIYDNELLFVETSSNLFYQDLDVLTLEEACAAETQVDKIKKQLQII